MRAEEVAGRTGKPPDGSAKTREAKAVTVWTAESRDADALLCGILDRSPMRLPWKAPLRPTSTPTAPTSPSGSAGAASPQPRVAWCWVMAQLGSGTPPANGSLQPLRCSTGITPNQLYTAPLHPFSARSSESTHGATARCAELGDGKLPAVVHALLAHRTSHAEATPCALYLFHSRARMRYPRFHSQGLCTSTGVVEAGCQVAIGTRLERAGMDGTECPHRPSLLQAQRAVRRLLGAPRGPDCRVSPSNLTCAPLEPRL